MGGGRGSPSAARAPNRAPWETSSAAAATDCATCSGVRPARSIGSIAGPAASSCGPNSMKSSMKKTQDAHMWRGRSLQVGLGAHQQLEDLHPLLGLASPLCRHVQQRGLVCESVVDIGSAPAAEALSVGQQRCKRQKTSKVCPRPSNRGPVLQAKTGAATAQWNLVPHRCSCSKNAAMPAWPSATATSNAFTNCGPGAVWMPGTICFGKSFKVS